MKIILNQNVENLGSVGDVVAVRDGFARNYLIPRGWAVLATPSSVKVVEREKAKDIQQEKEIKAQAEELAKKIRSISVTLETNAGDDGKLFGSVTPSHVQALLAKEDISIDKKDIRIAQSIRKVGAYEVEIRCYTNLKAALKLWVVAAKKAAESEGPATKIGGSASGGGQQTAEGPATETGGSEQKAEGK